MKHSIFALILLSFVSLLFGANLHYTLYKKESNNGPVMLIIGGIHGNEPGGYYAPQVFLKKYSITYGNVWIVPNLNFDSIIANQRGIYGDMNRKFASIDRNDKDFAIVSDIKKTIVDPSVDIILNLHDGHGFYRQRYINGLLNPNSWGQAYIIDQKILHGANKFGNLDEMARRVSKNASVSLIEESHEFNVKNTDTKTKDKDMQKSLTYFAIRSGKPAFAVETSKNITDTATKVLYQLKSLEEFMNATGIKFTRNFDLSIPEINKILAQNGFIRFNKSNTILPLDDLKDKNSFVPIAQGDTSYSSETPLVGIKTIPNVIGIYNGSKKLGYIQTVPAQMDNSLKEIEITSNGVVSKTKLAQIIPIHSPFKITVPSGYRVNVIGFTHNKYNDENGVEITKQKIDKRYSVDKSANCYRVEFYKGTSYCGNIIVQFDK